MWISTGNHLEGWVQCCGTPWFSRVADGFALAKLRWLILRHLDEICGSKRPPPNTFQLVLQFNSGKSFGNTFEHTHTHIPSDTLTDLMVRAPIWNQDRVDAWWCLPVPDHFDSQAFEQGIKYHGSSHFCCLKFPLLSKCHQPQNVHSMWPVIQGQTKILVPLVPTLQFDGPSL